MGYFKICENAFLQVSRCEKFGYGVMVTQVAATAPGVVALHSSGTVLLLVKQSILLYSVNTWVTPQYVLAGFVQALVVEIWSVLECGREDVRVVHPKSTPMDPIDRSCLKVNYFAQIFTVPCASTSMVSSCSLLRIISRTTQPWYSQSAFLGHQVSERTYYRECSWTGWMVYFSEQSSDWQWCYDCGPCSVSYSWWVGQRLSGRSILYSDRIGTRIVEDLQEWQCLFIFCCHLSPKLNNGI